MFPDFNATSAAQGLCDRFPPQGPEGRFWSDCTGRAGGDTCNSFCTLGYAYAYADGTEAQAADAAAALAGEQVRSISGWLSPASNREDATSVPVVRVDQYC